MRYVYVYYTRYNGYNKSDPLAVFTSIALAKRRLKEALDLPIMAWVYHTDTAPILYWKQGNHTIRRIKVNDTVQKHRDKRYPVEPLWYGVRA